MKTIRLVAWIAVIFWFVIAILMWTMTARTNEFIAQADSAPGVITDIIGGVTLHSNQEHKACVTYEVDGVLYENVPVDNGWDSSMYQGKEVIVYFNPETPDIPVLKLNQSIIKGLTIAFVLAGCFTMFMCRKFLFAKF